MAQGPTIRPSTPAGRRMDEARRNKVCTPCHNDFADTGNERWTEPASATHTRHEIKQLAAQCREHCPLVKECHALAKEQKRSAVGVWAGMYFRYGFEVDPFKGPHERRRSIYRLVYWDLHRGKWKAEGQRNYDYTHIGYFDEEDEAGAAVQLWEDGLDDDR